MVGAFRPGVRVHIAGRVGNLDCGEDDGRCGIPFSIKSKGFFY